MITRKHPSGNLNMLLKGTPSISAHTARTKEKLEKGAFFM